MESTLAKKITTKMFFYILGYFLILFVNFFSVMLSYFPYPKVATHCKE